ncbi:unnamed protein product [marine sediment metagenome]|uniref:Ribbon-helix-helix protein CopG domain-containing protein n=1 Tax=marine sediment metagenome TaxID=412755 RepID=X1CS16_9ZZZZ
MNRNGYTTIKIPNGMVENIDKIINDKKFGYKSRSEFVKEALRKHIKDLTAQTVQNLVSILKQRNNNE